MTNTKQVGMESNPTLSQTTRNRITWLRKTLSQRHAGRVIDLAVAEFYERTKAQLKVAELAKRRKSKLPARLIMRKGVWYDLSIGGKTVLNCPATTVAKLPAKLRQRLLRGGAVYDGTVFVQMVLAGAVVKDTLTVYPYAIGELFGRAAYRAARRATR